MNQLFTFDCILSTACVTSLSTEYFSLIVLLRFLANSSCICKKQTVLKLNYNKSPVYLTIYLACHLIHLTNKDVEYLIKNLSRIFF